MFLLFQQRRNFLFERVGGRASLFFCLLLSHFVISFGPFVWLLSCWVCLSFFFLFCFSLGLLSGWSTWTTQSFSFESNCYLEDCNLFNG